MLQIKELVKMQINKEIETLRKAESEGNIGKARVCARRAAALSINYKLEKDNIETKDFSALKSLIFAYENISYPENIKNAVSRLITKVNETGEKEISTIPLNDCLAIVDYFIEE